MPGFLVHMNAIVTCSHVGVALPNSPNPRVTVSGQPIVTMTCPYTIVGCTAPSVLLPPCASGVFIAGATRVLSNGSPVVVTASPSVCAPNLTPLLVSVTQTRVSAL
jgi:hypothetical protein